jgi:hypothetical protein
VLNIPHDTTVKATLPNHVPEIFTATATDKIDGLDAVSCSIAFF